MKLCLYIIVLPLIAIFDFAPTFCYAQGSWNINYIPIDSVNNTHIDKTFRLDFRSPDTKFKRGDKHDIRSYFLTKDTGTITIDEKDFRFVEHRIIYVDHGNYYDQYLECIDCGPDSIVVLEARILDIDKASIVVQIELENRKAGHPNIKQHKTVQIKKQQLDGLMFMDANPN